MRSSFTNSQLKKLQSPERSTEGFDVDDMARLTDFFSILISIDQRSKKVTNEKNKQEFSDSTSGFVDN